MTGGSNSVRGVSASGDIRILHVDDEPMLTELTATQLHREDDRFVVDSETDVSAAVDRIDESVYDCIVSDYDMPGSNGIEFLETVREEYPDLPFILFTGKGSEEVASDAISAGVTDYLQKQAGRDQYTVLANRVRNAVEKYRLEREAERTREQLERQNDLFEKAQDLASVGAWEYDFRTGETDWTNNVVDVPELSPDSDRTVEEILASLRPADRQAVRDAVERARTEHEPFDLELRITLPEVDDWIHIHGEPQTEAGDVVRIRGSFQNVTDRKERERELTESRERYRSLFENNPLVIWEEDFSDVKRELDSLSERVADVETYLTANPDETERLLAQVEILDVNENAVHHYDAPSKEALLENLDQVFTDAAYDTFISICGAIADGKTRFRDETVGRTFSGERRTEILSLYVPDQFADDYSRVYVTGIAITEREERERQLRQKNERLEEFTSIVSHDLRNPLRVADGRLTLAREDCESEHLDAIERAHERMEALIDDLLTLAREGKPVDETQTVALDEIVESCWQTAETANATLVAGTTHTIRADRSRLQQLLANLIQNAVEHGSRAPASQASQGEGVTITVGDLENGFYVADDGPGIPVAEREQVFESGYSTAQRGTGFGLAIVEDIAEAHGWEIRLTDSEDGGARFEVTGVEVVE